MKHLKAAKNCLSNINSDTDPYVIVNGNNITFIVQDGVIKDVGINGIQPVELIRFLKYLYESLNNKFNSKENEDTIYHLECAINRQMARVKDRSTDIRGFKK